MTIFSLVLQLVKTFVCSLLLVCGNTYSAKLSLSFIVFVKLSWMGSVCYAVLEYLGKTHSFMGIEM